MTDTTTDQLRQMVESTASDLADIANGEMPADIEADDEDQSPESAWLNAQLEIYRTTRQSYGHEPDVTGYGVLITYGGPTIRAETTATGWWTVTGTWGTDTATAEVYCPALTDYLADLWT